LIVGAATPLARSIAGLAHHGVTWVQDEITAIDVGARQIVTGSGQISWDHLVVALGVSYDWEAVPGSRDGYSFYDNESALRLRERLASFDGGSIVLGIGRPPYRCPPAPFEAALMIHSYLVRRGVRDRSAITVAIPEPAPLSVAGPAVSARIRGMLDDAGVELRTGLQAAAVTARSIAFVDGTTIEADLPITVPIHRVPAVVAAAGLADDGFVAVDRETLVTAVPGAYAIGDVNTIPVGDGAAIPKAGAFACGQGRHVAAVIASRLGTAPDPDPYDGVGHCFLMLGADSGAEIGGDFFAPGGPDVALAEPSVAGRRAKDEWEAAWARFEL
jgi:sulfide:quinone oxidoreductase